MDCTLRMDGKERAARRGVGGRVGGTWARDLGWDGWRAGYGSLEENREEIDFIREFQLKLNNTYNSISD